MRFERRDSNRRLEDSNWLRPLLLSLSSVKAPTCGESVRIRSFSSEGLPISLRGFLGISIFDKIMDRPLVISRSDGMLHSSSLISSQETEERESEPGDRPSDEIRRLELFFSPPGALYGIWLKTKKLYWYELCFSSILYTTEYFQM